MAPSQLAESCRGFAQTMLRACKRQRASYPLRLLPINWRSSRAGAYSVSGKGPAAAQLWLTHCAALDSQVSHLSGCSG